MTTREFIDWTICQYSPCRHQIVDHRFVGDRLECFFCSCKLHMDRITSDCRECACPETDHRYDWTGHWCLICRHMTSYDPDTVADTLKAKCGNCDHLIRAHMWRDTNRTAECLAINCQCLIGDKPQ